MPQDLGYPCSLRIPSKHLTQTLKNEKTGEERTFPRYYEFVAGEPLIVKDKEDFEHLVSLTWKVGRHNLPLFRQGRPARPAGVSAQRSVTNQIAYLNQQIELLKANAGISEATDTEVAEAL
jgi:hypothetical protein